MTSKEKIITLQFINHFTKHALEYYKEGDGEMYEWCQGKVNAVEDLLVWLGYEYGSDSLRKEVEKCKEQLEK